VLRDCVMIAVEGTHASGKTTLTYALAAHYREQGIHVAIVEEPARHSPFVEEIVVHGQGRFDFETEVDLFAAQLSAQLRAARQHTMVICDKTIANVLAYARIVLEAPPRSRTAVTLDAMNTFCRAWAGTYDAVLYCCDRFSQHQEGNPYRARVLDLQSAADRVVRSTCASVGQKVIDLPPGMTTAERVRWIAAGSPNSASLRVPRLPPERSPAEGVNACVSALRRQPEQSQLTFIAGLIANRAAWLLEVNSVRRSRPPGAQAGPGVRDKVTWRLGRVDPGEPGVFGRLAVDRLACPAGLGGKEPSDARLAARPAVVYHRDAPYLIWPQPHACFLCRLADSRVADSLVGLDVPRRRAQEPRRVRCPRRAPQHQNPAVPLEQHVGIHRDAQASCHLDLLVICPAGSSLRCPAGHLPAGSSLPSAITSGQVNSR
jgi:predicted ATPase